MNVDDMVEELPGLTGTLSSSLKYSWENLTSDPKFDQLLELVHDIFLYYHVVEATRANIILDLVFSNRKSTIMNVETGETSRNCGHSVIRVNIIFKNTDKEN